MSSETTTPLFNPPSIALLRAVSTPTDLTGAAHSFTGISSCIQAAAELWPNEAIKKWRLITKEMQGSLKFASPTANSVTLHLFNKPDSLPPQYGQFLNWRPPASKVGPIYEAHGLLGRALIHAAGRNEVLAKELLNGLQTLNLARQNKGRRSKDWTLLLDASFAHSDDLKKILETVPQDSPTLGFITTAIAALETLIQPPDLIFPDRRLESEHQVAIDVQDDSPRSPASLSREMIKPAEMADQEEITPDISARLAAADYAGFAEKLGLYHRDHLLPGDLAEVTAQLVKFIENGTPRERGFALLAILSLVTGCTDVIALELQFHPAHSIWLDLEQGAWAWNFTSYRMSKGDLSASDDVQPIFCPWPRIVDAPLKTAKDTSPGARNLKDLILAIQGTDHFDLKGYRRFLRNCGHPSHPPHRGRFARSLPRVYLELTGSDMTSALMAGFFAATAPAALFYFGPSYTTMNRRVAMVYQRLGLGTPSRLFSDSGRVGCQKVLETAQLQQGWHELTQAINTARAAALSATQQNDVQESCNRWMALLCAALVIQTAHRGTRLECLTAGALYAHPDIMVIQDKDEGGRAQPRLVPKTAAIKKILLSAVECHRVMHPLACPHTAGSLFRWEITDEVFLQWQIRNEVTTSEVLSTSAVTSITTEFFQSAANFGRSQWVTHLDENGCDRWLIRSLTGHTRDVTRTHGPYLDIPPLVVANRLCVEMEKTGALIFGEAEIQVGITDLPTINLPAMKRLRTHTLVNGPVPDPRTILEPLSVETLLEWRAAEQIRTDLLAGNIDAPCSALAVLHLMFIDHMPCPNLCISAVTETSKVLKSVDQRAGLNWARSHFVHPTWMPIQATTARLLDRMEDSAMSSATLIALTCAAIRKTKHCRWPASDSTCWGTLSAIAEGFRRLIFPPPICAVSNLSVAAPCLSELSLHRLAGAPVTAISQTPSRKSGGAKYARKGEDSRFLIATLGKYASSAERHGEKRARAIKCLEGLEDPDIAWSPFISWLKAWIVDELRRSRDGANGCYQISSILTYATTLLVAQKEIDLSVDPQDWEDDEWTTWVRQINRACATDESSALAVNDGGNLNDRAKHALHALVSSLMRRHEYVPPEVRAKLEFVAKTITLHGSASACLISTENHSRAIDILKEWNEDFPGDYALTAFRPIVSQMAPLRAGDVSSFTTRCLTPNGGLVIERVGYDVHKTENAIRVVPLTQGQASQLREKMNELQAYFGERPLLLRGDGSTASGLRDQRLSADWAAALKDATGDRQARPHSVRAATLQEIAWPRWQELAQKILNSEAGPRECRDWLDEQEKDWTRLSRAVAMAGQGDLRAALGNYLAGWPLIYAMVAMASLHEKVPGPGFLKQLGISPATLRQARSRSNRP